MFDKYTVGNTEYVPYEKSVIEKRAPTDESIRLYEEIKEKAYDSILHTIKINDNSLNIVAVIVEVFDGFGKVCKYRYTLNGKEIKGEVALDTFAFKIDPQTVFKNIFEDVAKHLAIELLTIVAEGKAESLN